MLKENFKDEIPNGDKRLYGLVDGNGNYVYRDLQIVRTNSNKQNGDKFGAAEVNQITSTINDIVDGTIPVSKATTATNLAGVGVTEIVQKSISGIGNKPPQSNDGLNISFGGNMNGYIEWISNISPNSAKNLPIPNFLGYKIQYSQSDSQAAVILYEVYPDNGNMWIQTYNNGWKTWKLVSGRVDLWTGSASSGNIPTTCPKAYFNSLDVFFTDGERVNCPLVSGNEDIWGSLITTAGIQFYLKSVHLQFTQDKTITIFSCKEKDLTTGNVSDKTIYKIVGRP